MLHVPLLINSLQLVLTLSTAHLSWPLLVSWSLPGGCKGVDQKEEISAGKSIGGLPAETPSYCQQ